VTLLEAIQDIFEGLGEPSDLQYTDRADPSVLVATPTAKQLRAWTRLVGVINRAQAEISAWKFPDGRQLRFRTATKKTIFKTQIASETVSCSAGSFILSGTIAGAYTAEESWVLTVDGESAQVLGSTATEIWLDRAITNAQTNAVATLARRRYQWDPVAIGTGVDIPYGVGGAIPAVVHALQTVDGTLLELLAELPKTVDVASPTQAFCTRSYVEFAQAPDAVQAYLVVYTAGPEQFSLVYGTDQTEELRLPAQYHTGVVLWGLWWGYRRAQENSSAYSTKRDLDDFLRRTRSEADFNDDFRQVQLSYTTQ
jgi:hypothetical protein